MHHIQKVAAFCKTATLFGKIFFIISTFRKKVNFSSPKVWAPPALPGRVSGGEPAVREMTKRKTRLSSCLSSETSNATHDTTSRTFPPKSPHRLEGRWNREKGISKNRQVPDGTCRFLVRPKGLEPPTFRTGNSISLTPVSFALQWLPVSLYPHFHQLFHRYHPKRKPTGEASPGPCGCRYWPWSVCRNAP